MNIKKFFGKKIFMFLSLILLVSFVVYFFKNSNKSSEFFNNMNDVSIVATCPSGYKQYTDKPGNSVCCAGNIDYINSSCKGETCTLHTQVENPTKPGKFYEKCSEGAYTIIKNKFNFEIIGAPGSSVYNIKQENEVKDLETYKKQFCDKDKKCFGAGEINLTINKTQKIRAFFSFPKVDLTNLISTPYDLKNGYVYDNITLHIKK